MADTNGPVALTHKDIEEVYVAPNQDVADVLAKSGWKPAPKSVQADVVPTAPTTSK